MIYISWQVFAFTAEPRTVISLNKGLHGLEKQQFSTKTSGSGHLKTNYFPIIYAFFFYYSYNCNYNLHVSDNNI